MLRSSLFGFLILLSGVVGFSRKLLSSVCDLLPGASGNIFARALHTAFGIFRWRFITLLRGGCFLRLLLCGQKRTPRKLFRRSCDAIHNAGCSICRSFLYISQQCLPPHLRFTGLGRHIAVQLGIFREAIDERHERVADLHQAVSRLGVGDVFHLILRDVEKLR